MKEHNLKNNIIFEELRINEINSFSELVINVFDEFVGKDYSEEGNKTFKEFLEPGKILDRWNNKTSIIYAAKKEDDIVGILEIKNKNHISLFFVKKDFHKLGIGKKLFYNYLNFLKQSNEGIEKITVNSSFYAEKIYSKLGFIRTDEIQEKNGIKYIPMEYRL